MDKFKVVKYIYNEIEDALAKSSSLTKLFKEEDVYEDHQITILNNGRFLLVFKLKDNAGSSDMY